MLTVMKKKIQKLIEKSLRFHHQDIHAEIHEVKLLLAQVLAKLENEPETVAEVVKHELNNTSFKWNNEYKFVPAGQKDNGMLTFEDLSKVS